MSNFGILKKTGKPRTYCKPCEVNVVRETRSRNPERYRRLNRESRNRRMSDPVKKQHILNVRKIKREEVKLKVIDYLKSHPCVDCGETDIIVLEFDHIDPGDKLNDISKLIHHKYSWDTIRKEISKCEVRCGSCHTRRTATQLKYKKAKVKGTCIICGEDDNVVLSNTKDGVMCINCHRRHTAKKQNWFKASV